MLQQDHIPLMLSLNAICDS
uniref:Uncharacterized protein n=1 Tax=Anguilla anguilla TaxID=7936 RepID=A0A0E9SZA1_ANGAN